MVGGFKKLLFGVALLGCACQSSPPAEICPDAGLTSIHSLCTLWISAATRLCSPDSGVCGSASNFDCPDSCVWGEPFHCQGYVLDICGQVGTDDLNRVLDAGTCADLLPTAFEYGSCEGDALPK
jgi:hypothetical protein